LYLKIRIFTEDFQCKTTRGCWAAPSGAGLGPARGEARAVLKEFPDERAQMETAAFVLALAGDLATARTAYQDFLTWWTDADPDLPVLVAAKTGYEKVK
jgi:hypothetical protein